MNGKDNMVADSNIIQKYDDEIKRLTHLLDVTESLLQAVLNNSLAREDMLKYIQDRADEENKHLDAYKLYYSNLRIEIAREVCDRLKAAAHFSEDFGEAAVTCYDIDCLLRKMEDE